MTVRDRRGGVYEIVLGTRLGPRSLAALPGFAVIAGGPNTRLRGAVADQAALHGVLARIRDLGVPLVSVAEVGAEGSDQPE